MLAKRCHSSEQIYRGRMNTLTIYAVLLFAGLAWSNPIASDDDEVLQINKNFFPEELRTYTSQHDIVKIFTPLNSLNFDEESESENLYIFFVEADTDSDGKTVEKGLSVLNNGEATKLLENGRDAAASSDDTKQVFFGASDGIYIYNVEKNTAEKYGSVTDDIISIAKENGTDAIYYVNSNHEVYKVTDEGNTKEKMDKLKDVYQIVLDTENAIFYVDGDKHIHVYINDEVRKIKGLPENPSFVQLLRPPFVFEQSVPAVVGNKVYTVYQNGSAEFGNVVLEVHPTAFSAEATLIQYYAYDKKIYEYNILALILGSVIEEVKSFFEDKVDQIQSIATRSRSDFGA